MYVCPHPPKRVIEKSLSVFFLAKYTTLDHTVLLAVALFFITERSIASFFFFHRTVLCVLTIVATPLMYTDWMIRRYALPFTGLSGARWHTVLYSGQTSKYRRMIRCWLLTSYRTSAPAHILAWMNTVRSIMFIVPQH